MTLFRLYLIALFIGLTAYTVPVIQTHGWDLLSVFFGSIRTGDWSGQFNLDFMMMLSLSALWVAWRHQFSAAGLALGLCAFFGGAMFLTAYLVLMATQAKGDVRVLLLGPGRA